MQRNPPATAGLKPLVVCTAPFFVPAGRTQNMQAPTARTTRTTAARLRRFSGFVAVVFILGFLPVPGVAAQDAGPTEVVFQAPYTAASEPVVTGKTTSHASALTGEIVLSATAGPAWRGGASDDQETTGFVMVSHELPEGAQRVEYLVQTIEAFQDAGDGYIWATIGQYGAPTWRLADSVPGTHFLVVTATNVPPGAVVDLVVGANVAASAWGPECCFNFAPLGHASLEVVVESVRATIYPAESSNQAPVARDDAYAVEQDRTLAVPAPGVLGNDEDPEGGALTAHLESSPTHGMLTLATDGSFQYEPEAGFVGTDEFTYTAKDAAGATATARVVIQVEEAAPARGVELSPESQSGIVAASESIVYEILVTNTGTARDTIGLEKTANAKGWKASLSTASVTLEADESVVVELTVTAPKGKNASGSFTVTVTGTSVSDAAASATASATTTVSG